MPRTSRRRSTSTAEGWTSTHTKAGRAEKVKEAFRRGEIRVLLCTEAASEGLNLQTCGVLVNYDMPWNPMRVEQRIGRFDRIGQRHRDVWIHHYLLVGPNHEPTVEARVYEVLGERIGWFRSVVGELQPILQVSAVIEEAAMAPRAQRADLLDRLVSELQSEIEARESEAVQLEELALQPEAPDERPVPLTLAELERVLRESSIRDRLQPHPAIAGALYLDLHGRQWEVTFDPVVADAHPGRVRLLTPGEPLLSDLLELVLPPTAADSGEGVLRASTGETTRWYAVRGDALAPVESLSQLRVALEDPREVRDVHVGRALEDVEAAVGEIRKRSEELEKARQEERRAEIEERG